MKKKARITEIKMGQACDEQDVLRQEQIADRRRMLELGEMLRHYLPPFTRVEEVTMAACDGSITAVNAVVNGQPLRAFGKCYEQALRRLADTYCLVEANKRPKAAAAAI
jgi:hypothetical protein